MSQHDLFSPLNLSIDPTMANLLPYDGIVQDYGVIFGQDDADAYFDALYNGIDWQHDVVKLYGKTVTTARQVAWYGDDGVQYRYSGSTRTALPWSELLLKLKTNIEAHLAAIHLISFNACLLNLYHDGSQGMGWHSDDEPELGQMPIIASLSLGATRKFVLRHKSSKQKIELSLAHGQLIVMHGSTQRYWQHALMKTTKVQQPRINLTFRQML